MLGKLGQFVLLVMVFGCMQCVYDNGKSVTVEKEVILSSLPSGSGLALVGENVFIVGDDSPYLFQLSSQYNCITKHILLVEYATINRIPKEFKPDFECIAEVEDNGRQYLFVFGSGAKSPERDSLFRINVADPEHVDEFSLTTFYEKILEVENISREDLNIEGAVVAKEKLYLFNRAKNSIIAINIQAFNNYLHGILSVNDLVMGVYSYRLPQINGYEARFSGACALPGEEKILFTATIEETGNWIDDGLVHGSYVGVIDVKKLKQGKLDAISPIADRMGVPVKDKVESIAFQRFDDNRDILALAVADNDDGASKLLELRIKR